MQRLSLELRYPGIARAARLPGAQFRMRYLRCRVMFNIFYPVSIVFLWTHFIPVTLQDAAEFAGNSLRGRLVPTLERTHNYGPANRKPL